eukprot:6506642-Pyramimonas_sp.AAC.1
MLVPLHAAFSSTLVAEVGTAITSLVSFLANIQIVSILVYLGLVLGPAADDDSSWLAPSIKVKLHSKLVGVVGGSPMAVSRLATHYATRIAPVLSYAAQFRMMLPWLLREELLALARTFRVPLGVFNISAWLQLRGAGG